MKPSYIYYLLEQMRAWVMKNWKLLLLMSLKYVSLVVFIGISIYLSMRFLTDEIVSGHLEYEDYLELIKKLYSEDPLKSVLPFSIFAMVMSLWSVFWRIIDKNIEFKNAEFAQNELRFSNAVNLLSKKGDPVFFSEGIRELVRLKREGKITPKRIDQLTSSKLILESGSFSNADFKGMNLAYANLKKADLTEANLENANLENASLENADLTNANLKNANLKNTNGPIIGSSTINLNLKNANLENANLENANLSQANLERANLKNASLKNAHLIRAILIGANLTNANLEDATLPRELLRHEIRQQITLTGANVKGTILENIII